MVIKARKPQPIKNSALPLDDLLYNKFMSYYSLGSWVQIDVFLPVKPDEKKL